MLYRYNSSGPRTPIGCGLFLAVLGLVLLAPLIDVLIDILGWTLLVLGWASRRGESCRGCSTGAGGTAGNSFPTSSLLFQKEGRTTPVRPSLSAQALPRCHSSV